MLMDIWGWALKRDRGRKLVQERQGNAKRPDILLRTNGNRKRWCSERRIRLSGIRTNGAARFSGIENVRNSDNFRAWDTKC